MIHLLNLGIAEPVSTLGQESKPLLAVSLHDRSDAAQARDRLNRVKSGTIAETQS